MKIPTQEELCDELCNAEYCPWIEVHKYSIVGTPNGPLACEGNCCNEAYDNWLAENTVTCECCGEDCLLTDAQKYSDDCHEYYVCNDCMALLENTDEP